MRRLGLLTALALIAACGGSKSDTASQPQTSPSPYIDGFNPPAVGPDEIQIVSPVYRDIQPGQDVTFCSYIANPFKENVDVIASLGVQSKPGHHAILYDVGNSGTPGDTHVCTDDDMQRSRLIGGAVDSAQNFPIPDGIGLQVKAGTNLLMQTHWVNSTTKIITGQAVFNVKTKPSDGSRQPAQSITVYSTRFNIPAHAKGDTVTECEVKQDLTMFLLAGHEHASGSRVHIERVTGDNAASLLDVVWQPEFQTNPPRNNYTKDAPLKFQKGDKFRVTCEWNNQTDQSLGFPVEMCVGFGMYYPATHDIDCGDGHWAETAE